MKRQCFYSEFATKETPAPTDCERHVAKSDQDGCWTKSSAICAPCLKRFWGWHRSFWRAKGML